MTLHDFDFLFAAASVLGAGVMFSTPGLLSDTPPPRTWSYWSMRAVAAVVMIFCGALASDLFGETGSWSGLAKTAVALWLPAFLLGAVTQARITWAREDAEETGPERPEGGDPDGLTQHG